MLMNRKLTASLMLICALSLAGVGTAQQGVRLDITAGEATVTDWIVEQRLDLATAARVLGYEDGVRAEDVRVVEVDVNGREIGVMTSQVDTSQQEGEFVVTWQMPGETPAGARRRFLVKLDGEGEVPLPDVPVSVSADNSTITVTNGAVTLEHLRAIGGMIGRVTVGETTGAFSWDDKAYDGTIYYLADHPAEEMKVIAAGPLRVVVETQGEYLDGSKRAASHPRATYHFTSYAGQPVTQVKALVTQDFDKQWRSLWFATISFDQAPFDTYVTDQVGSGTLVEAAKFYGGDEWAAVYGDNLLLGVANGSSSGIWDGGARIVRPYLRAGETAWSASRHSWQATLFWGSGRQDVETLKSWGTVMASPPTVTVQLDPLAERLVAGKTALAAQEEQLARLTSEQWARAHVAVLLARGYLAKAGTCVATGAFGTAEEALSKAQDVFTAQAGASNLRVIDGVMSGLVAGYPFLANDSVVFVWLRPEDGAGLLSIYDRRARREFLSTNPAAASLWSIGVKRGESGKGYTNSEARCTIAAIDQGLQFSWLEGMKVEVTATLAPNQTLARLRLSAEPRETDEGLMTVTFPIIRGILPLTPNAADDVILRTEGSGSEWPSPLASGKALASSYPGHMSMQFSALMGAGRGLYFAEEDPQASRKTFTWLPQQVEGTLDFTVAHPVLDWAGSQLVKEYSSPGDVVIGPFQGDWYDVARLYRKWALTAPWCAKGPTYARADYPQWLARAPYWTIGDFGCEEEIQDEIDKFKAFDVPIGVCHAYKYWYSPQQGDYNPDYLPPRLGSVGLKQTVERLRQMGMRVIPYIDGEWHKESESYRMENAAQGAQLLPTGEVRFVGYYGGQSRAQMCPGSALWRDKLTEIAKELVGRYGMAGVYFDYYTNRYSVCHNPDHGHPLGGGNFWTKSMRECYGHIRRELKKLDPDIMMTSEGHAEFVIDVIDTALQIGDVGAVVPMFQAIYHDYTLLYGGELYAHEPHNLGRWWLLGNQNGWTGYEMGFVRALRGENDAALQAAQYYRKLLRCHYDFARPYLAYGEMLRSPRIRGEVPTIGTDTAYGTYATLPVVEGSAWRAPDGSVGIFLLNYDKEQSHEFSWTVDLRKEAGWTRDTRLNLYQWTEAQGREFVGEVSGGRLRRHVTIQPWGLIALRLEVAE